MKSIKVSIFNLRKAIQSKDEMDALALAIAIKATYCSSALHKTDIRNIKHKFGIGSEKAIRSLNLALEKAYIVKKDNMLIAKKVKSDNHNRILVLQDNFSIKHIVKELKRLAILLHIETNEKLYSLKNKASNPNNLKEMKRARRIIKEWSMDKFETDGGLSYGAIARKANISVRSAILLVNELVEECLIKKQTFKIELINYDDERIGNTFFYKGIRMFQRSNVYSLLAL